MNKIILIGNLTRDPELTQTNGGISRCNFSIAVGRNYANAQGEKETDFFNIVTWRGLAENCNKYLKKGNKVAIIGTAQIQSYEADGQKRRAMDIVADEVEFLITSREKSADEVGAGNADSAPASKFGKKSNASELKPAEDETLPF